MRPIEHKQDNAQWQCALSPLCSIGHSGAILTPDLKSPQLEACNERLIFPIILNFTFIKHRE